MDGGLFSKAKTGATDTQLKADKETLTAAVVGCYNGTTGEIEGGNLDDNLDGWTIVDKNGKWECKSSNGNYFIVTKSGKITDGKVEGKTLNKNLENFDKTALMNVEPDLYSCGDYTAKLTYKCGEKSICIIVNRSGSCDYEPEFSVTCDGNTYLYRTCTNSSYFKDDGSHLYESIGCFGYPHAPKQRWVKMSSKTCDHENGHGNLFDELESDVIFEGKWEIDENNSTELGKQYLSNILVNI